MEKEEKKGGCCGEEVKTGCCEEGAKCEHSMANCCHNWKKCHMMKKVIMVVVIIIAFCVGSQWGEMKGEYRRSYNFERRGMMNSDYGRFENRYRGEQAKSTSEVTVDVTKTPTPPATPKQ